MHALDMGRGSAARPRLRHPGVERALAYVAGGLAGFGALALVAFQGFTAKANVTESPPSLVVSMVHIVATGGTLGAVHLLLVLAGDDRPLVVFFAVGGLATVAYNLLLLLEELLVQRVA